MSRQNYISWWSDSLIIALACTSLCPHRFVPGAGKMSGLLFHVLGPGYSMDWLCFAQFLDHHDWDCSVTCDSEGKHPSLSQCHSFQQEVQMSLIQPCFVNIPAESSPKRISCSALILLKLFKQLRFTFQPSSRTS